MCVTDASFWFFRSYFATAFLLDSPTFAVTVFAIVVLRGLLGSFFPAELFTGLSLRGEGARAFPLNWKALPTSKTCVCVCVRMLESAPGTRPSAQFDCLDLGLAVCRSFRVAAVLLRVLRPPPACSAQVPATSSTSCAGASVLRLQLSWCCCCAVSLAFLELHR